MTVGRTRGQQGICLLIALVVFTGRTSPELLQPACEASVIEPIARSYLEGFLHSDRYELGDVPLAAIDTVPVLQGFGGPLGCGTACLKARSRLEHCVVRREYILRNAVVRGLAGVVLDNLALDASCDWWHVMGSDDILVNASVSVRAPLDVALTGDLIDVSHCLVGDFTADGRHDDMVESVEPEESVLLATATASDWSHRSIASVSNFRLDVKAEVVANGCAVKAVDVKALSLRFDAMSTDVPIAHTFASLVMDDDWVQSRFSALVRNNLDVALAASLPFDAITC